MKVDIKMQGSTLDKKNSSQISRRVRFALSRFSTSVSIITVRITDINTSMGGVNMRCVVSVKMEPTKEIVVQGDGENIFSALDYCLSRAKRTISRNIERFRDTPIRMTRRGTAVEEKHVFPEKE